MRAFLVWFDYADEGGAEIVMASSMTDAKRRSEFRWQGIARKHLRAKRYPKFDGYQHVTDGDLLKDGWTIYCGECERRFNRDTLLKANVDPGLIGRSGNCPYCAPEDYGLAAVEDEDEDVRLVPGGAP